MIDPMSLILGKARQTPWPAREIQPAPFDMASRNNNVRPLDYRFSVEETSHGTTSSRVVT
jgi:hypothetical protein